MDRQLSPSDQLAREVEQGQQEKPWQRYLDAELGLRNYWYPALFSHELPEGEMQPLTLLGERLFFKRIDGKVYCIEDRCLHRGARQLTRVGAASLPGRDNNQERTTSMTTVTFYHSVM